eukprot:259065-Hanusia_phi.AAC.2
MTVLDPQGPSSVTGSSRQLPPPLSGCILWTRRQAHGERLAAESPIRDILVGGPTRRRCISRTYAARRWATSTQAESLSGHPPSLGGPGLGRMVTITHPYNTAGALSPQSAPLRHTDNRRSSSIA